MGIISFKKALISLNLKYYTGNIFPSDLVVIAAPLYDENDMIIIVMLNVFNVTLILNDRNNHE